MWLALLLGCPRAVEVTPAPRACLVRVYAREGVGPIDVFAAPGGSKRGVLPSQPVDGPMSGGPILVLGGVVGEGEWYRYVAIDDFNRPANPGPETGWIRGADAAGARLRVDWISADVPAFARPSGGASLRERPDANSAVAGKVGTGTVQEVLDCDGGWVRVRVTSAGGQPVVGWLPREEQCGHPQTSCAVPFDPVRDLPEQR